MDKRSCLRSSLVPSRSCLRFGALLRPSLVCLGLWLSVLAAPSFAQSPDKEKGSTVEATAQNPADQETEASKDPEAPKEAQTKGEKGSEDKKERKRRRGKKDKKDKPLKGKALRAAVEALPEKYRVWAEGVQYIISDEELRLFVEIEKDYQRDAFIERFWKIRDPYPETGRNEFRENYNLRMREAQQYFGGKFDDRTKVLLTNGFPLNRIPINCKPLLVPLEVWYYDGSDTVGFEFLLIFYQRWGMGDYRLWEPADGLSDLSLQGDPINFRTIENGCKIRDAEALKSALSFIRAQGGANGTGWSVLLAKITASPTAPQKEWVETFATYTTELPDDAELFDAELQVNYPGRHQGRTVVQGALAVDPTLLEPVVVGGLSRSYNLLVTGEILKDGALFDNFRYQFDFPAGPVEEAGANDDEGSSAEAGSEDNSVPTGPLPLVFQRYLRSADYQLMVKVEDLGSGRFHRSEMPITVPIMDAPPPPNLDEKTAAILKEANDAIRGSDVTLKIAPLTGEWQTGLVRIDTLSTGDGIHKVSFFLDDQPILTKRRPPFDVELDLGNVPRARVLRVEGYDADGEVLASDETLINSGDHRFGIRLEEPRPGRRYRRSLRAEANVVVPKGEVVSRVEFYLNDTKITTLYQEPWVHPILLPEDEPVAYVRAVAYMPDGAMTEDLVFVNAPPNIEQIDVEFVELYTLVLDRNNRPVLGLEAEQFQILEDEVPQEMVRFEVVDNLPIHAAIMLDVSASMEGRLIPARDAALQFFQQTLTPKDRATTVTFNDHPQLANDFTNDLQTLAAGLAGVKAERGTSLYDALIFTLYYFNGIKGQKAILLLSDGKDESSRFEFEDVLEYARRSGVSIYAIGLEWERGEGEAKRKLRRLAEETGGRSFFLDTVAELPAAYDTIQQELRSRYLIAYQSSNTSGDLGFRQIEVLTDDRKLEAKTLKGYYP